MDLHGHLVLPILPKGVLDRFKQIEPKVLISCDYYYYNGKKINILEK